VSSGRRARARRLHATFWSSGSVLADQVATTFTDMRSALAARLAELRDANAALSDRNTRLTALQADLMQATASSPQGAWSRSSRTRFATRRVAAKLSRALELIRRRVEHDPEAREFADLAIDELLRMRKLAEQMLGMARPRDPAAIRCRPVLVAREVARLTSVDSAHANASVLGVDVAGDDRIEAAVAPDALKQVLLNLVQNSRDAGTAGGPARIGIMVGIDGSAEPGGRPLSHVFQAMP